MVEDEATDSNVMRGEPGHFIRCVGQPLGHHQVVILRVVELKTSILDCNPSKVSSILLEFEPDSSVSIAAVSVDRLAQDRLEIFHRSTGVDLVISNADTVVAINVARQDSLRSTVEELQSGTLCQIGRAHV